MSGRSRQGGAALITAILITSLAAILATNMAFRQTVDIRRAANILQGDQAYQYALGMERFAVYALKEDQKNSSSDSLDEAWTQTMAVPLGEASLEGWLIDENRRFNLNSLLDGNGKVVPVAKERFDRLLNNLAIPTDISNAVIDWMDDDSIPLMGGAEDDTYQSKDRPYRTPNSRMSDRSELLLIEGMTREYYEKLWLHVTALPVASTINVNTAGKEVIMMLADGLHVEDVDTWSENRPVYEKVDDFIADSLFSHLDKEAKPKPAGLSVTSDHFTANSRVALDEGRAYLQSLLLRDNSGKIEILRRKQGAFRDERDVSSTSN